LFRATALGLTLLVLLVGAEFFVRIFELVPPRIEQRDAVLGVRLIPNQSGWWRVGRDRIHFQINSLGFRGPEVLLQKKPGVFRVLIVGDSQVFCGERPYRKTFMARLQKRFVERGLPIEIVPMGVNNYSTAQEYLAYKLIGRKLDPDLVIVMFFVGNDFFNNMGPCNERPCYRVKDGRLIKLPFKRRDLNTGLVRDWLRRNVRLYTLLPNLFRQLGHALKFKRQQAKQSRPVKKKGRARPSAWELPAIFSRQMWRAVDLLSSGDSRLMYAATNLSGWWAMAYQVTFKILEKWSAEVKAAGGRLVVVDVPWYDQMYDDRYALAMRAVPMWLFPIGTWDRFNVQKRFSSWSRQSGVPFYNLAAAMRRVIKKRGTQFFDGLHFVDSGHEFGARFLARIIERYYRNRHTTR
jgi:hypothetical protein